MKKEVFDVLIIGGGVAGITAGVYAKRRGKNVAIIEKFTLGGQVMSLPKIENFPSQQLIDGLSLVQMFSEQVKHLDIPVINDEILSVDFSGELKVLHGKRNPYYAKSVIIATGLSSVALGANEDDFLGKGVSFCAVCDANFFKNQVVCVASKNGSGIKATNHLAGVCSKVLLFDSGDLSNFAKMNKNTKIQVVSNAQILKIQGNNVVEKVVANVDGEDQIFDTNALFVELGKRAKTDIYAGILNLDSAGFVVTDECMRTNVPGVFAVGDVRSGQLKQIVTACNDGAIAGQLA